MRETHASDSSTILVEELGLCQGDARVDLAVISTFIHGYEIKSERDTLARLADQQKIYNRVLDQVTLVASTRHLAKTERIVPSWWGLSEAHNVCGKVTIREIRPAEKNPNIDPAALVQLLWRNEALTLLRARGLHKDVANKRRAFLWERLEKCLSVAELRSAVTQHIRLRQHWRPAHPQG